MADKIGITIDMDRLKIRDMRKYYGLDISEMEFGDTLDFLGKVVVVSDGREMEDLPMPYIKEIIAAAKIAMENLVSGEDSKN